MARIGCPLLSSLLLRRSTGKPHVSLLHTLQGTQTTRTIPKVQNFKTIPTKIVHYGRGAVRSVTTYNLNYIPKLVKRVQSEAYHFGYCSNTSVCCPRAGITAKPYFQVRYFPTLNQIRKQKPRTKRKKPKMPIPKDKKILIGPQRRGVCVKLVVRTPKKPNSAQRKCAILRLSNGKMITAYIPGEKGALQEHGVVLFEGGRVQDCPGIKYKIIRRKYDMN